MKTGDYVRTPRFLTVKISTMFCSENDAREHGFTEPTHYDNAVYDIFGKSCGENCMIFAGVIKDTCRNGFDAVVEYSHFDEHDTKVYLYPAGKSEEGLADRYNAYLAEEKREEPENIDRNNSYLDKDEGYGIIRFIKGGYVEFFLTTCS